MKMSLQQRGIALIMALLTLLLLSAIGLSIVFMVNTETGVNYNFRSSQQAYYGAKAGVEEGRTRLRLSDPNAIAPPTVMPSSATNAGVIYILNPAAGEVVAPWDASNKYFDNELCHENFIGLYGAGLANRYTPDVPCAAPPPGNFYTTVNSTDPNRGTNNAMPYKWTRITLKQNWSTFPYCANGPADNSGHCPGGAVNDATTVCAGSAATEQLLTPGYATCEAAAVKSVYVITSLAVTPTGSRRMTQFEVANIMLPPMPSTVVFDGSNPVYSAPSSNAFVVDGNDHASPTDPYCPGNPGAPDPALGAFDNPATTQLTNFANNRPASYIGAGGSPSVLNVGGQLGALTTVGGLQAMVQAITNNADQVVTSPATPSSLGTVSSPKINVVNGDFTMSGSTAGAGILLVTGNLTFQGTPTFNGIILVIGKGSVTKNGGGNGTLTGTLFVANLYNSSGQLLSSSSAPGVPTFNWNGGGTALFQYNSCWTNLVVNKFLSRVLASREEIY